MRGRRRLDGSVVVITGASSGIGRAAAIAFARQGANVIVGARRLDVLQQTAEDCRAKGVDAVALAVDTAKDDEIDALASAAINRFGGFDVWINNASTLVFGNLLQTPAEGYRRAIEVNLLGYVNGARAALRHFEDRGEGVLINNASLFSVMPTGYTNAYSVTKQAVAGLSDALRQEVAPAKGIHVVKILPAGVDTPILQHAANYTGRRVRPVYPLVSAERVARVMVSCARRPRRSVIVGGVGRVHAALYRLHPSLAGWIYGYAAALALRRADPVPRTDGILFTPTDEGTATDGGLRKGFGRWPLMGATVVALGTVVAARRRNRPAVRSSHS